MANGTLPPPETLRQLLRYEPDTGKLFWKQRDASFCKSKRAQKIFNTKHAGKQAFTSIDSLGYCQTSLSLGSQRYQLRAHRVAYAIMVGAWPDMDIDHINNNRTDNRWSNLRAATRSQNLANKKSLGGASSFIGVAKAKNGKWCGYAAKAGKRHIKTFDAEIDAAKWRDDMALRLHGEFAKLNFGGKNDL